MALQDRSRSLSGAQLAEAARHPSHVDAKGQLYSKWAYSAPGRSSHRPTYSASPYLELRLLSASADTGPRTWLTARDLAILQALDSYRYLDRSQLQALFFDGIRSCQMRLKWLTDRRLVGRWDVVVRPGHCRAASIHFLTSHGGRVLAEHRGEPPIPFIRRAEHSLARHHHVVHDLEANEFFVDLARATRVSSGLGLYHWAGEHGIRRAYADEGEKGPLADGWGRVLVGDRELLIHLEWDRGTEQTRRLHGKLQAYVRYFRDRTDAFCNHVLLVAPTAQREDQLRRVSGRLIPRTGECCRFWTARHECLQTDGPLGRIWAAAGSDGSRLGLEEMPSRPGAGRPPKTCVGKPRWWLQRPGGGEGV